MGFLGVYRAIYDYAPQAEGELAIDEGDLLYILDNNGDDGWWRAKKKAGVENDEEPEGLVPNNYVEPAPAQSQARAVFDYTRQTDEELSFPEDAILEVFDTSDPDWILAGLDDEYGFVPANYIAVQEPTASSKALPHAKSPALPARSRSGVVEQEHESRMDMPSSSTNLALTLTDVVQGQKSRVGDPPSSSLPQPPRETVHSEPQASDEDENYQTPHSPALPSRPRPSQHVDPRSYQDVPSRTPMVSFSEPSGCEDPDRTPGSFHMYNINEMVSVMGKKKKMPTTLGINLKTGIILIAPERAQDDPAQEWTADKMTHYSREGKHVFMELIQPSRSIDFHAGAKDTAEEIVGSLSELAGAIRAEGLREVIMAGSQRSQRKGKILYDFMAQGDDEVTVAAGDDVSILDDSTSEEWWQVRRLKNSNQGVVPSSYIEITGSITPIVATYSDVDSAKATVEQNRLEEIRLTKEAIRASKQPQQVGMGMNLPERGSSLVAKEHSNNLGQQRSRHETGRTDGDEHPKAKSKPELTKVRAWTDRSGSFTVEAQFLGLKDGKIHLHKMNGVKIAVPITKMSRADLGYVESATGISLDDDRPLADVKTAKSAEKNRLSEVGATVGKSENIDYDWFEFFLACEVAVGLCERYAQAFARDSMDESVLPDVNATILRTLGLREGDIIKVMRKLDAKGEFKVIQHYIHWVR
ncbi:hypothetical protein RJ55_06730 [Drechmeria coniospora]|nr:hypothetical protein RJ55_06730 [Drechmeria coniospora]